LTSFTICYLTPLASHIDLHSFPTRRSSDLRIYIAISAAGAFRTDDGGKTWKPINKGLHSQYIPDPNAEVGHCECKPLLMGYQVRSEEHTSELQSPYDLVCRLLLEKKKK